ncbi:MAG TPA: hypothetical protein VIH21_10095 [Dehalococcoidia bacterium]|jgi:hypothetical protein
MKKWTVAALTVAGLGASLFAATQAFGAAGSGGSADTRNDEFVVICHYDRNNQGPNAGPHTITINVNALDHHLTNHTKNKDFIGDDFVGPCQEVTPNPSPSPEPSASASPTN